MKTRNVPGYNDKTETRAIMVLFDLVPLLLPPINYWPNIKNMNTKYMLHGPWITTTTILFKVQRVAVLSSIKVQVMFPGKLRTFVGILIMY
jgi:hypothetical protein